MPGKQQLIHSVQPPYTLADLLSNPVGGMAPAWHLQLRVWEERLWLL